MKLSDIKAVSQKIEGGAWVSDLPNLPGVAVKVRGYGNSDYRKTLAKLRSALTPEQLADEVTQDGMDVRLVIDTILIDWSGIEEPEGVALPFSREKAEQLLTDPDLAIFRMGVNYAASVVAKDGKQSLEADAKN